MCEDAVKTTVAEFDVRRLNPTQRDGMIFDRIYDLAFGASFILIEDHDPKPFLHQLETEFPRQFFSTYVEAGPSVWRVEVGRHEKAAWRSAAR
jgi:uncharacterized protein (DUF2249 family)